ncbi:hypothetical protein OK074_6505 [Actinobacteria bacterium OK074]|nr:hypothetical protein OK074_6505 [Actinobacteria bacterium OK074]
MRGLAVCDTGSSTILRAVEQRIGSSSQPLETAAVDPAYVPGLPSPVSASVSGKDPEAASGSEEPEETAETADAPVAEAEDTPAAEDAPAAESDEDGDDGDGDDEESADPDGPVFEAADRRARIVADHAGVRLSLDDQSCEFRWDEIAAVETETLRFGKRFTVTVYTPENRWFPIEIEANSRSRFTEWESDLDAVLDKYFEDDAQPDETQPDETRSAEEESDESAP